MRARSVRWCVFCLQITERTGVAYTLSLDMWYEAFAARAESVHGIKLKEADTRQQSVGRAALSQKTFKDSTEHVLALIVESRAASYTQQHRQRARCRVVV